MVLVPNKLPKLPPAEYFDWEEQQPCHHEYINGEVYVMGGDTQNHSRIALKCAVLLENHLPDDPCRVFNSDCRVHIVDTNDYTYPDVSVSCDARDKTTTQYITYPCLIIEVLAESTEAYDRGNKFFSLSPKPTVTRLSVS